jgi:hypothetical protein
MTGPLDRDRLAKLLGLLGSDHDGEVTAAARQAEHLRRAAKLTWSEILSTAGPRENPDLRHLFEQLVVDNDRLLARIVELEAANARLRTQTQTTPPVPENLDEMLCRLLVWERHLSDWERGFVHDLIRRRRRRLSPKQCASLGDIVSKIDFYRRHQEGSA